MIIVAVLFAQYAGTLDVSDVTRVDARTTQVCQPAEVVLPQGYPRCTGTIVATKIPEQVLIAGDVSTTVSAKLALGDRSWDFGLAYIPTVTAPDFELGIYPQVFQSGSASVGWHDRFTSVFVSETASYGILNSGLLYQFPQAPTPTTTGSQTTTPTQTTTPAQSTPVQTTTPLQTEPTATNLRFGASSSNVTFSTRLTRRATLGLTGGYTFGGGLTAYSRAYLPLQYGPSAGVSASYTLSRVDSIATAARAQDSFTSGPCSILTPGTVAGVQTQGAGGQCKIEAPIAQLLETLQHRLSPTAALNLAAGAAVLEAQEIILPTTLRRVVEIQPVASVGFIESLDAEHLSALALSASLAPYVDPRTGLPSSRFQMSASFVDQFLPQTAATATLSWLQSVPFVTDPYPLTAIGGGVEVKTHVVRELLDLSLGEQQLWQSQAGYGTFFSLIGYVSATVHAPTLQF